MQWPDLDVSKETGLDCIKVIAWYDKNNGKYTNHFSDYYFFSMHFNFKNDSTSYPTSFNCFKSTFKYTPGTIIIHHWPIGIPIEKATTTLSLRTWTAIKDSKSYHHYSIQLNKVKDNKIIKELTKWEDTIDLNELKGEDDEICFDLTYPTEKQTQK